MKRLAIRAISEISAASPGKKGSKVSGQIANAEVSNAVRIELTHSLSSNPLAMPILSQTTTPRDSATTPSYSSTIEADWKVSRPLSTTLSDRESPKHLLRASETSTSSTTSYLESRGRSGRT
jgi:hypothetical protein